MRRTAHARLPASNTPPKTPNYNRSNKPASCTKQPTLRQSSLPALGSGVHMQRVAAAASAYTSSSSSSLPAHYQSSHSSVCISPASLHIPSMYKEPPHFSSIHRATILRRKSTSGPHDSPCQITQKGPGVLATQVSNTRLTKHGVSPIGPAGSTHTCLYVNTSICKEADYTVNAKAAHLQAMLHREHSHVCGREEHGQPRSTAWHFLQSWPHRYTARLTT